MSIPRGGYHNIRSRAQAPTGNIVDEMAAQGRRPFQTYNGTVFGTRPGAPLSANDTMNLGIEAPIGAPKHDADWAQFFNRHAPSQTPVASAAAVDPNDDSQPAGAIPAAHDHLMASIEANSNWLGSAGIAFPPPPSPLSRSTTPTTRPLQFPTGDPSLQKSQFTGAGGVDPDYAARDLAFNKSLYAPADTQQPPLATPSRWQGPTAPITAGDYVSRFGTASVSNMPTGTTLPASTKDWGTNTDA